MSLDTAPGLTTNDGLRTEVLETKRDLAAHQASWETLWNEDPMSTIFLSFSWITEWIESYGRYIDRLFVILFYREDKLVGIAPLYVRRPRLGPLGELFFLGTGEAETEEACAEYLDLIALESHRAACVLALAGLVHSDPRIAGVTLLRVSSGISRLAIALEEKGWSIRDRRALGWSYALGDADGEGAEGFGSSFFRKRKRLERLPGYAVQVAGCESERQLLLESLIELHQKRWLAKGQPGAFASPVFRHFHEQLSCRLLAEGALLLYAVRVCDVVLAINYCLLGHGICHYYQGGIDTSFRPNVSPGTVAHLIGAELAYSRGCLSYDLMLGGADSYKRAIARPWRQLASFTLTRRRYLGLLFKARDRLQSTGSMTRPIGKAGIPGVSTAGQVSMAPS